MSIEDLNQFCRQVLDNPELLEQFQSCPNQETLVRLVVHWGQQYRFNITPDDVMQKIEEVTAAGGELTYPVETEDLTRKVGSVAASTY